MPTFLQLEREKKPTTPWGWSLWSLRKVRRGFVKLVGGDGHSLPEAQEAVLPLEIEEVCCLVRYSIDHGLDTDQGDRDELAKVLFVHVLQQDEALREKDEQINASQGDVEPLPLPADDSGATAVLVIGEEARIDPKTDLPEDFFQRASRLNKFVYEKHEVNGRTIRDSARHSAANISRTGFVAMVMFVLALLPIIVEPENPSMIEAVRIFEHLSPFLWGAVGASIFLMKKLSEKASGSMYDTRRLTGVVTRIFLGGAIAFVALNFFHIEQYFNDQSDKFIKYTGPSAIAFLCGLGYKAIYSVFEFLLAIFTSSFSKKK